MAKDEPGGPGGSVAAAAVAAVEKHFAMHGLYGLPSSAGATVGPSAQTQRPMKHSGSRDESFQEDQDAFLSTSHSKCDRDDQRQTFDPLSRISSDFWHFSPWSRMYKDHRD